MRRVILAATLMFTVAAAPVPGSALDAIADSLNNRPRATHDFHSPLEVFARLLKQVDLQQPVQPSTSIH